MTVFRNAVFLAAVTGIVAGIVMTGLQLAFTVPLILEAETFENAMPAEEPGGGRFGGEIGVEAEHHVGPRAGAFELQAVQHRHAIAHGDPVDGAAAVLLEGGLDLRARSPFGDEAVVGVNGQRLAGQGGRGDDKKREQNGKDIFHGTSIRLWMEDWTPGSGFRSQSLRRHDPDQVQRVEAVCLSQPAELAPR